MLGSFLRQRFRYTWVLLSVAALVSATFSQTNSTKIVSSASPVQNPVSHSLHLNVNLVLVPVSVTDSLHHPVTGLQKWNFELIEGHETQQIRYFSQEDEPISLALLLDISGSMSDNIDVLRAAVHQFFVNANSLDEYTVVTVSDRPEVLIRGSQSIDDIQATLDIVKPGGWTALLDSIRVAALALRSARYPRRAILIVSDGLDNVSRHHLKDVATYIEESDIDVYAIGVKDEALPFVGLLEERIDKKLLMRITDVTGGHTEVVQNAAELPRVAASLSQAMRSQYVLGYCPTDGARTRMWRKIKVQVRTGDDTILRTYYKKQYFTPGDSDFRTPLQD